MDPTLFAPAHVRSLDVYQPGKPIEELERELGIRGAIKVASNENPLGPSPKALAAIPLAVNQLHLYPDAGGFALRRALSTKLGVTTDELSLGNGSNDMLYQLVLATCELTDEVLSHKFAFLSYRLSAQVAGRTFVAAAVTPELACDVDALIAAITPRTKLIVLGSPNNPTGSVITKAQAERILAALPARALLVFDEAYAEYAAAWPEVDHVDGLALRVKDPRIVVLRTFSKIYGLAGLRVGFTISAPAIADVLEKVRPPYNLSSLDQAAAVFALREAATWCLARAADVVEERAKLAAALAPYGDVFESEANLILVRFGAGRASTLWQGLADRGIVVRNFDSPAGGPLAGCLRITVGTVEENALLLAALAELA